MHIKITFIGTGSAFCPMVMNDLVLDDEAYTEGLRWKLLHAMLLGPATISYYGAVVTINELFERQKDILPILSW